MMVEFWREISGAFCCWATVFALLVVSIWQLKRVFFPNRSRARGSFLVPDSAHTISPSPPPPGVVNQNQNKPSLRISEMVSDGDLKELIDNLDDKFNGNGVWENVIDRRTNLFSYTAKCCKPKDAPLRYMSVTVFENCSSEMLRDFYMDNDYRKQWDKTLLDHEQLEVDETNGTEIGRMIKKYPFLTPREYILAWRLWEGEDKTFYCFIKDCEHPSAPKQEKFVRVRLFRSGWRIRKVPGRNACEIKMLHQEDAGLNVEMAKLAFAKGIWSYVCKMDNALRRYPEVHRSQTSSAVNAVTLIHKVPPGIDSSNHKTGSDHITRSVDSARSGQISTGEPNGGKLTRRPSKKLVAKGLLVIGGAICLSRGHSNLGAKVAMAYILAKLSKRGASSSQSRGSNSGETPG